VLWWKYSVLPPYWNEGCISMIKLSKITIDIVLSPVHIPFLRLTKYGDGIIKVVGDGMYPSLKCRPHHDLRNVVMQKHLLILFSTDL
jgi:hypothetical protein